MIDWMDVYSQSCDDNIRDFSFLERILDNWIIGILEMLLDKGIIEMKDVVKLYREVNEENDKSFDKYYGRFEKEE